MAQDFPYDSNTDDIINDVLNNPTAQDIIAVSRARDSGAANYDQMQLDFDNMSYGQIRAKYGDEVAANVYKLSEGSERLFDSDQRDRSFGEAATDSALGFISGAGNITGSVLAPVTGYLAGGREGAVERSKANSEFWSEFNQNNISDTVQDKQRFSAIEGELDSFESEMQYREEVEDGADPFTAALRRVGRDTFNAGERTLRDGALAGQVVSEGLGSLLPSAIIAGATGGAGGALFAAGTRAQKVASYTGSAIGIGAVEASGTYADTVSSILDMPEKDLMNSEVYQAMLAEYDGDTARARVELAGLTGETAFVTNLPASIALGMLTARFEAMPIRSFKGAGVAGGLRTVIAQGFEEAGQGAASALTGNYAQDTTAGIDTDLAEGVGEQAALGAIGGVGMAGVVGAPATLAYTGSVASKAVKGTATAAKGQVVKALDDRKEDRKSAVANIDAATAAVEEAPEVTVGTLENDFRVVKRAIDIGRKPPTEGARATVAASIGNVRRAAANMSGGAKEYMMGMLDNSLIQELESEFYNYDPSNDVPVEITPAVVQETVSLAETNPANVNPDTVDRILEQNNDELSPEKLKILKTAAKVSKSINKAVDANIKINEDENINLSKIGKPTRAGQSQPDTSRSIIADGYVDRNDQELRSVNDFAADFVAAAQSPNGRIINAQGYEVSAKDIAKEFWNFVTHMNNKVNSLNQSIEQNNEKGTGPTVGYDTLVGGTDFVPSGHKDAGAVYVHTKNPSSIALAQRVASDRDVAQEVYETMASAFPEHFEGLTKPVKNDLTKVETKQEEAVAPTETVVETESTSEAKVEQTVEAEPEVIEEDVVNVDELEVVEEAPRTDETEEESFEQSEKEDDEVESADEVDQVVDDSIKAIQEVIASVAETTDVPILDEKPAGKSLAAFNQRQKNIRIDSKGVSADFDNNLSYLDGDGGPSSAQKKVVFENINVADFKKFIKSKGVEVYTQFLLAHELKHAEQIIEKKLSYPNDLMDPLAIAMEREANEAGFAAIGYDPILVESEVNTQDDRNLHESFENAYIQQPGTLAVDGLVEFVGMSGVNPYLQTFAAKFIPNWKVRMNRRLNKNDKQTQDIGGKSGSVKELLKNGVIQTIRRFRNTAIVNTETGRYDDQLVELTGLAVSDWLMNARANMLNEVRDDLGKMELTKEEFETLITSVPLQQSVEQISNDVLRMWNVKRNPKATLSEDVGIVEGVVKEMMTAVADSGFVNIVEVPAMVDGKQVTTTGFQLTDKLEQTQKGVQSVAEKTETQSVKETLFGEKVNGYSVGVKHDQVANTQNRSQVKLSQTTRKALKTMQDTPHYRNNDLTMLATLMGDSLKTMLGYVDVDPEGNQALYKSQKGKNISIDNALTDAMEVVDSIGSSNAEVYYSVGATRVGRHQYQGINPQNNKILRALVTPTWATINLNDENEVAAFWIGIAQASDIYKIEKRNQQELTEADVNAEFMKEYGTAVEIVETFLETGNLEGNLAEAMGKVEMQQLAAVFAVAQYNQAKKKGQTSFETSLSVELDGLTNGVANMMINFGQGMISPNEFENMKRVGLYLGKGGQSINDYFGDGTKKDLYETVAERAGLHVKNVRKKMKPVKRAQLDAAMRFSAYFGDMKRLDNGDVEMTRNTAKNPMTKINYGSGIMGVGTGLAQNMLIEYYAQVQNKPTDVSYAEYFGYPEFQDDLRLLFGNTLDEGTPNDFEFPRKAIKGFEQNISFTLGKVLTEATHQVIGNDIADLNKNMVYSTGIQANYIKLLMEKRLLEVAPVNEKGVPELAKITRENYDRIVKELEPFTAVFQDADQTLDLGGFEKMKADLELSSNMDENMRQKSFLKVPKLPGVKAIPFLVIGSGDAMMMNLIYSRLADKLGGKTLPIFDGIDMPVTMLKELGPLINEQVAATWDRDVYGQVVNNFEKFMGLELDQDLLKEAMVASQDKFGEDDPRLSMTSQDLLNDMYERHKLIKARKAVAKRTVRSIDQMGGSAVPHTTEGVEMELKDINNEIRKELNIPVKKEAKSEPSEPVETVEETAQALAEVYDGGNWLMAWSRDIKKSRHYDVFVKIANSKNFPKGMKVVVGSIDQLNEWKNQNTNSTAVINTDGAYDPFNNVMYVSPKAKTETIMHEVIHAFTMSNVLAHYEGTRVHEAVPMLEKLMDEYLSENPNPKVEAAIVRFQTSENAYNKAAALNEFMAWALSNAWVKKGLEKKNPVVKIAQRVVQWMGKLLGFNVPQNMFDEVLMTTAYLGQDIAPDDSGNNNNNNDNGSNTTEPPTPYEKATGFWMDLARQWTSTQNTKELDEQALSYVDSARDIMDALDGTGLLRSPKERQNFGAVYTLMSAELPLNAPMAEGLYKLYDHYTENVDQTVLPNNGMATVTSVMNSRKGTTDALGIFLALSQSSETFRSTLNTIPGLEGQKARASSLEEFIGQMTNHLVNKLTSRENLDGNLNETIDRLSRSLIELDAEEEYRGVRALTGSMRKADQYVSGKLSQLANITTDKNAEIQKSESARAVKFLSNAVTTVSSMLDASKAELEANHVNQSLDKNPFMNGMLGLPIRELVNELIGIDSDDMNTLVQKLDEINYRVVMMRQQVRDKLPQMLRDLLPNTDAAQLNTVIMKTDLVSLSSNYRTDEIMELVTDKDKLTEVITDLEKQAEKAFKNSQLILDKAQALADYMLDGIPSIDLQSNAHAIVYVNEKTLDADKIALVDQLTSLYALRETDTDGMVELDIDGVGKLFNWIRMADFAENDKPKTSMAQMNAVKGYQPHISGNRTRMMVNPTSIKEQAKRNGWRELRRLDHQSTPFPMSYYVSTIQEQTYSQGAIQNVSQTYRGVDIRSGFPVDAADIIVDDTEMRIISSYYKNTDTSGETDGFMPLYNETGDVVGYRFQPSKDVLAELEPEQDIFTLAGVSYGRQVEEKAAHHYNKELINILHDQWENRPEGSDDEFVNLARSSDKVHKEGYSLIPKYLKQDIETKFGKKNFMVKKRYSNLVVGYRDPSIRDIFTGKNRMSAEMNKTTGQVLNFMFRGNAKRVLGKGEEYWQEAVTTAKQTIILKSVTVVKDNAVSNVFQLATRGVPLKRIVKGTRDKIRELEEFQKIESTIMELKIKREFVKNSGERKAITDRINNMQSRKNTMSIAPLIKAGQFKSLVEGLTEQDANNMRDVEGTIVRLAEQYGGAAGKNIARYGLVSKDTPIYSFMNTATQYGDLVAKSIYYDHLISEGLSEDAALRKMNEEFVNFSLLPGRTRSGLERFGLTWFFAYKIKIAKVALRMARENPVSSLALQAVGPDVGNPMDDNLFALGVDRLDFATGTEMLFAAPDMHIWSQVMGWD